MPRRKRADPPCIIKTVIPKSLKMKVDLLLLDPVAARVRYGALSGLITRMLQEWVDKQIKERNEDDGRKRTA